MFVLKAMRQYTGNYPLKLIIRQSFTEKFILLVYSILFSLFLFFTEL